MGDDAYTGGCSSPEAALVKEEPQDYQEDQRDTDEMDEDSVFIKEEMLDISMVVSGEGSRGRKQKWRVCGDCGYRTFRRPNFVRHLRIHTGEKPYSCKLCDYTCSDPSAMYSHRRTHTGERPFQCDFCDSKFARKGKLKEHLKIHSKREYSCVECDFKTHDGRIYHNHRRKHAKSPPYTCDICGHTESTKIYLKYHILWHLGAKPYRCDFCDFVSNSISGIKEHMLDHSEVRYPCAVCLREFQTRNGLARHKRRHSRTYRCLACGDSFATQEKLSKHTKEHEMRYKCETCERGFPTVRKFKRHLKDHIGDLFRCDYCPYTARRSRHLRLHAITHSVLKPHVCTTCGAGYCRRDALAKHEKTAHHTLKHRTV